jgi:tetratricopeptide (TPR) repeat protein
MAKQVCDGLGEAHGLGIVHRDLKPNNIMIDDLGNAKIMDFGIARTVKSKGITGSGVMIGTPEYMSPEQVDGKDVDLRTDIYAMGVILYEMLTGQLPFEGDTPFTVGVKQKSEIPQSPQEINPNLSDDLSRVILRCLEKERDARYQSTEELCADLESIEKGLPTTARVAPARKPLTSREITVQFSLRKAVLPALGVLAAVAVGLILWHPWSKDEVGPIASSDRPSLAVMYFENNTGEENLDNWRKGISDLLITDLTQSRYLKVLGGDRLFDILSEMDQLEARSYSSGVLKEVAAQGGVNHIVRGSYSKAGDILRINLVLQDAQSGEPIATHSVEGKGEEAIFPLVDELTRWTKESLRLSSEQMASDLDQQIGKVATSSPEAYKFYAEGCDFFQKEEYEQSIATFEKAVALDPEFAMAYRKISVAFGNLGKWEERRHYIQKALELSERLTEREKLLIQGTYFGSYTTAIDKAIEAYEKLVSLYPESSEAFTAYHNLGSLYFAIEDWEKAIQNFRLAMESELNVRMTHASLAQTYMANGDYREAEAFLKSTIERFPDYKLGYWNLARLYAFQGQFDLALDEVERAAAIDPTYTKAQFFHLMGDLEKAEKG